MRFTKLGDMQAVTRITGPHHHFLGIQFSPGPTTALPVLERVSCDSIEAASEAFDSPKTLCREVVNGVSEANNRLGTHYAVSKIRYCADDLLIPGVYRQLAQALVEHVAQEKENPAVGLAEKSDHRGRVRRIEVDEDGVWAVGPEGPASAADPRSLMNESRRAINVDK